MNWYEEFQQHQQSELEAKYISLSRRIRAYQMRYEVAKSDPANPKEVINDLYWEVEELKGRLKQTETELREQNVRSRKPRSNPAA